MRPGSSQKVFYLRNCLFGVPKSAVPIKDKPRMFVSYMGHFGAVSNTETKLDGIHAANHGCFLLILITCDYLRYL